ncbi:MAG: DUF4062 domain-containing protein [Phycisphaerales bacterium JB060]
MTQKTKIFVSSTIENLKDERAAVRRTIEAFGYEPVMAEHDFPARSVTPREACLDGVRNADWYVGILGDKYGYVPDDSDVSVTEEEHEEARRLGKPRFWFIKQCDRKPAQQAFLERISQYADGVFRKEFADPSALSDLIIRCFRDHEQYVRSTFREPGEASATLSKAFGRCFASEKQPHFIVCAVPASRHTEVDLPELDGDSLEDWIVARLRSQDVSIFDKRSSYEAEKLTYGVRLAQESKHHRPAPTVWIWPDLRVVGAIPATASRDGGHDPFIGMIMDMDILRSAVPRFGAFASSLYQHIARTPDMFLHAAAVSTEGQLLGAYRTVNSISPPMGKGIEDPLFAGCGALRVVQPEGIKDASERLVSHIERSFKVAGLKFEPDNRPPFL